MRKIAVVLSILTVLAALAGSVEAAQTAHSCQITRVQIIPGGSARVAFKCQAPAPGGIYWFAFRQSDSADTTKMILSLATAAKIAGRPIDVVFESTDTSGAAWGCQANDCRRIRWVEMK